MSTNTFTHAAISSTGRAALCSTGPTRTYLTGIPIRSKTLFTGASNPYTHESTRALFRSSSFLVLPNNFVHSFGAPRQERRVGTGFGGSLRALYIAHRPWYQIGPWRPGPDGLLAAVIIVGAAFLCSQVLALKQDQLALGGSGVDGSALTGEHLEPLRCVRSGHGRR